MRFLKKLGSIILKGAKLVLGIGSSLPQGSSKIIDKLSEIMDVILQFQFFGLALGLPGSQKLKAAGPAVAQIILSSAILANRKIDDKALFAQGTTKIANGMADILNSLDDKVETEDHD